MKTITKVLWITRFVALSLTPASAQPADLTKEGDYYAASKTIVQRATPRELNGFEHGDYYAPGAKQSSSDQPRKN